MSSFHSNSQSDSANAASTVRETVAPPAETLRACGDRERRLTEYIRAHTGEDIAVRLTPHVQTACVMPTSEEALIESDNAEFSDDQAHQLAESVDADYLVLISTHPANVDNLPIADQLTADRAQQFGYALHELGHIRYTAIADAAALLEERVDEEYQEFVHGLWNGCEDTAIENQLTLDQSQIAADRLELVNRSISTHVDGFAPDDRYEFTFRDAIETALYDDGIYDTGVRDALCDPDDERVVFAGDADQQAFEQVADSLEELVATVLSTPNSVERAEHILDWWKTVVKPLLDPPEQKPQESEHPNPDGATGESSISARDSGSSESSTSSNGREIDQSADGSANTDRSLTGNAAGQTEGNTPDSPTPADKPHRSRYDESTTADEMNETSETDETERTNEIDEMGSPEARNGPNPDAINTDQRQPSPGADALDYPDIGDDEDADALDQPASGGEDEEEDTNETADSTAEAGNHEETAESSDEQFSRNSSSGANHEDTTDTVDESNEQNSESATPESQPDENPWKASNNTSQTSLGSFSTSSPQIESETNSSDGENIGETPATASTTTHDDSSLHTGGATGTESESESKSGSKTNESATESTPESTTTDDGDHKSGDTSTESMTEGSEHPSTPTPAHVDGGENGGLDREGALDADRDAAHDEAERATPDEDALERDLEDVADALDALAEQDGGGAAPGPLSELTIMPDTGGSGTSVTVERWEEAAADAEFVADALRKALKESRRDAHRSGVTSGRFDRQRAGALARGDVGAFHVRQPGDDKQYDLVMILDRSGSMRKHIQTAEDALSRFALACEDIGINVGVIDFLDTEARLIKPFSVTCNHIHESLLSERTGGNTPLADALGLGRELLEQRRNSPLVLVVTDGKPGDEDVYHDELAQSYAPVCGLTLVLDQPPGSVPEKVARNEQFYDRHVYVHEPDQLANRLDQFAVMFDGL